MTTAHTNLAADGNPVVRLESAYLRADIAPTIGGRVISLVHKQSGHEFLWRNQNLRLSQLAPGSEYDPNFYGGIDELLPNDIPETINGIPCPDHGELWTTPLKWSLTDAKLRLAGTLLLFGLRYEREMSLRPDEPILDLNYRITNLTSQTRQFLWKLHAALAISEGDVVECPARQGQVVDPAWSRFRTVTPFVWPEIEEQKANVMPEKDGTVDFFYLFDLEAGEMGLRSLGQNLEFTYRFDKAVFPYSWLFASYGGFNGHYTAVLEPCTCMPLSVNQAAPLNRCSNLAPNQVLETSVSIYAGPITSR
jgi:hypothetical protein